MQKISKPIKKSTSRGANQPGPVIIIEHSEGQNRAGQPLCDTDSKFNLKLSFLYLEAKADEMAQFVKVLAQMK